MTDLNRPSSGEAGDGQLSPRVGYGSPPEHSRYKPGCSGNPRGRPKEAKSNKAFVEKHLHENVTIREQGRERVCTKLEAGLLLMAARYAKADPKVFEMVNQLLARPEAQTIRKRVALDFSKLTLDEQMAILSEHTDRQIRRQSSPREEWTPIRLNDEPSWWEPPVKSEEGLPRRKFATD